MFSEDDLIQISAIQHYRFCKRQCALIHIENIWKENFFTMEGNLIHTRVHKEEKEKRKEVVFQRGLLVRSLTYGIIGKCDLVEFFYSNGHIKRVIPVEYKRGKPKEQDYDSVQLCAQALCLEEMLNISIDYGYLYYNKIKHRHRVSLDIELKRTTINLINELRNFLEIGKTPLPEITDKCNRCSLNFDCLPKAIKKRKKVKNYIHESIRELSDL